MKITAKIHRATRALVRAKLALWDAQLAFENAVEKEIPDFSALNVWCSNFDAPEDVKEIPHSMITEIAKDLLADEDACTECGEDASGGEGFNGKCGNCADRADGKL